MGSKPLMSCETPTHLSPQQMRAIEPIRTMQLFYKHNSITAYHNLVPQTWKKTRCFITPIDTHRETTIASRTLTARTTMSSLFQHLLRELRHEALWVSWQNLVMFPHPLEYRARITRWETFQIQLPRWQWTDKVKSSRDLEESRKKCLTVAEKLKSDSHSQTTAMVRAKEEWGRPSESATACWSKSMMRFKRIRNSEELEPTQVSCSSISIISNPIHWEAEVVQASTTIRASKISIVV